MHFISRPERQRCILLLHEPCRCMQPILRHYCYSTSCIRLATMNGSSQQRGPKYGTTFEPRVVVHGINSSSHDNRRCGRCNIHCIPYLAITSARQRSICRHSFNHRLTTILVYYAAHHHAMHVSVIVMHMPDFEAEARFRLLRLLWAHVGSLSLWREPVVGLRHARKQIWSLCSVSTAAIVMAWHMSHCVRFFSACMLCDKALSCLKDF